MDEKTTETAHIGVRVQKPLKNRLEKYLAETDKIMSRVVERAIQEHLDRVAP